MKRKDWRIKKLRKNIYGKFLKRRRIFFLRKLFLRKHLVLVKKNLIPHYIYYYYLLKSLSETKKKITENLYINTKLNGTIFLPSFFFSKNFFHLFYDFKNLAKSNKLVYFYLNNFYTKNKKSLPFSGNNLIVFGDISSLKLPENKNVIDFKFFLNPEFNINLMSDFNIHFNFNFVFLINLELYKIITLLYINAELKKLKKIINK